MNDSEYCKTLGIDVALVEFWISEGWLKPHLAAGRRGFRQADIARGQLIQDLTHHMGVNDAGVDVAMGLLDQIHGLRQAMSSVMTAIGRQDAEIRARILAHLDRD